MHVETSRAVGSDSFECNVSKPEIAHLVNDVDWFHGYHIFVDADHNREVITIVVQLLDVVFPQHLLVEVTAPTNVRVP
ncbi:hypothetical protein D3C85_1458000 [compost metagenome]